MQEMHPHNSRNLVPCIEVPCSRFLSSGSFFVLLEISVLCLIWSVSPWRVKVCRLIFPKRTSNFSDPFCLVFVVEGGGVWLKLKAMKTARSNAAATAFGGKIYVVGGCDDDGALKGVEVYDPRESQWEVIGDMATARQDCALVVVQEELWVIGGMNSSGMLICSERYNPAEKVMLL